MQKKYNLEIRQNWNLIFQFPWEWYQLTDGGLLFQVQHYIHIDTRQAALNEFLNPCFVLFCDVVSPSLFPLQLVSDEIGTKRINQR